MIILGIDYGDARTGLAICDKSELLASPLFTVNERNTELLCEKICEAAVQYGAQRLVIGHPVNMDGSDGPRAQKCAVFAGLLTEKSGLPCDLFDERCTTQLAHRELSVTDTRGKKRRQAIDTLSAVLILEGYLARRKNTGR